MPINYKSQATKNSDIYLKTRSNGKRLSLSKKSHQNNPSSQNLQNKLPTLGRIFATELVDNRQLSKDTMRNNLKIRLKIDKEKKLNRSISIQQKVLQNSKEKKQILVSRPKLITIDQPPSRMYHKTDKFEEMLEPSISDILFSQFDDKTPKIGKPQKQIILTMFSTHQNCKKKNKLVDVCIQTDNCQINKSSYDQYIKFRITQKQKFSKLKSLFQYFQNLSSLQSSNFKTNIKQFSDIIFSKNQNIGEQKVSNLLIQLNKKFKNFNSIFKDVFSKERQNLKDFYQNHNDFLSHNKKILKDIQNKLTKLNTQKESSTNQKALEGIFQQAFIVHQTLAKQNNRQFNQKMGLFYTNYKELEQKYFQWNQSTLEQSKLIKNYVMNILELPALSFGLFGLESLNDPDETNEEIKNLSVNNKFESYIVDFFMKKTHPQANQINDIFMKCCEAKCMNCIYMKTKMRFIYNKNNELKPVINALMNLVDTDKAQSQFNKIASQRLLNSTSKKLN